VAVRPERRSEEEIRREIAAERQQLADSITDLRASVAAMKRPAVRAAGLVAAGVAAMVALRIARAFRS
jgi:signal transduction histidine kinase